MEPTERNDVVVLHPAIAVTGRVMFALIFFLSGITHFTNLSDYVALMPAPIPVYDLVREAVYSATDTEPLAIPEEAIVVPGSRAVSHPVGAKWGLSLQAAVIVKYRDAKTDARVQLEDLLR